MDKLQEIYNRMTFDFKSGCITENGDIKPLTDDQKELLESYLNEIEEILKER